MLDRKVQFTVVLKQKILDAIRAREIDLVFRRWKRPGVKAGRQLKTALGVLAIRELNSIEVEQISSEESLRAGYPELKELVETLVGETGTVLYQRRVQKERKKPEGEGGGNFHSTRRFRLGKPFAAAVVRSARRGTILYRDAYRLLGLRGLTFDRYASEQLGL